MQSYIYWALLGMVGYSFTTLFTKLAERSGDVSCTFLWAVAGGLALTVAVTSLFHALSLGPANVVVPIYGMFIVGGSLLGVLFLGEPMSWNKIVGLAAAVFGVMLVSI